MELGVEPRLWIYHVRGPSFGKRCYKLARSLVEQEHVIRLTNQVPGNIVNAAQCVGHSEELIEWKIGV